MRSSKSGVELNNTNPSKSYLVLGANSNVINYIRVNQLDSLGTFEYESFSEKVNYAGCLYFSPLLAEQDQVKKRIELYIPCVSLSVDKPITKEELEVRLQKARYNEFIEANHFFNAPIKKLVTNKISVLVLGLKDQVEPFMRKHAKALNLTIEKDKTKLYLLYDRQINAAVYDGLEAPFKFIHRTTRDVGILSDKEVSRVLLINPNEAMLATVSKLQHIHKKFITTIMVNPINMNFDIEKLKLQLTKGDINFVEIATIPVGEPEKESDEQSKAGELQMISLNKGN